jgi:hypothetical protein
MRGPLQRGPATAGARLQRHKSIVPAGNLADAFLVPAMVNGKLGNRSHRAPGQAGSATRAGYSTQGTVAERAEVTFQLGPARAVVTSEGRFAWLIRGVETSARSPPAVPRRSAWMDKIES